MTQISRLIVGVLFALALAACAAPPAPTGDIPRVFAAGDTIFHADKRWLGGDAAVSVDLGKGRILWLFGDSFVDLTAPYRRDEAAFIRNSIAVETGANPRHARMAFFWHSDAKGRPASFFPEQGTDWFWPGEAVRLDDGTLAVFLQRVHAVTGGFGFETNGYAVMRIANPEDDPPRWKMTLINGPALPFDALPGAVVLRDGPYVVALAVKQAGTHAGAFMRLTAADLARGDFSAMDWWAGNAKGWVKTSAVGKDGPAFVIADAGAEASIHWDVCAKAFVHVASYGFGASEIGLRTAPRLTGPWSEPRLAFRPPEADLAGAFLYAGRAHEELTAPKGTLLATYISSSFKPDELLTEGGQATFYWPRFALIAAPACR